MAEGTPRRDVLRASAASLASAVALAGCSGNSDPAGGTTEGGEQGGEATSDGAQPSGEKTDRTGGSTVGGSGDQSADVVLGGEIEGWLGRVPSRIGEKTNPTLRLTPGTEYVLAWKNLDGKEHELILESGDGERLAATESAESMGATRSVTFTATEEMASYYCEYHPEDMRGELRVDGGGDGS